MYQPLSRVEEEWYNPVLSPIDIEEWVLMLNEVKLKSAPGISNVTYELIKQANHKVQIIFKNFANLCLVRGCIPDKWKVAQIYTIPKGEDWGFDLGRVRPIALLEAFRKCVTRVITKRLSKVCIEKNILQGPNFAGLPKDSTEELIHILNALLEEAQEKNKELWLLFQDMKKAFDSVSF